MGRSGARAAHEDGSAVGRGRASQNSLKVPVAASDISDRYLKKAIAEINELGAELARSAGPDRAP